MRDKTAEERIEGALASRIEDIHELQRRLEADDEGADDERFGWPLGVSLKRTVVVQVSTGGPGDQFECDVDEDGVIEHVTYRFLDWFDGATRRVDDDATIEWLQYFVDLETGNY